MTVNSGRMFLLFLILAAVCLECHSLLSPLRSRSRRNTNVQILESDSCSAPIIENGNFIFLDRSLRNYTPGQVDSVPNYVSIKFSCNQNYALFPNRDIITCYDGNWSASVPTCKLTCPPLTSTTLDIECTLNNKTADCTKPVFDGTVAKTKCKDFYVSVHTYSVPTIRCKGGYWDKSLIQCIPDCGEGVAKGLTNIINGNRTKLGEFPWHIAIYHLEYDKYVYKCGGSIIHPLIVLSAAHCFEDKSGVRVPANEYYIAAAKYHSAYNSQEDKLAQIIQVKEYHIPPYYSGILSNYQADLVVIVLKTKFQLSNLVRPVCIDWNREFEREQLLAGSNGSVVGWGYEAPDKYKESTYLKKLTAPFIEISKCLTVVPEDFKRWVTPDKFCAGFTTGFSVCQGDSGGGMVFPWYVNNKLKYYLRGIVSVGPFDNDGFCDSHQYGVYTQISHYSDFIQEIVANNTEVEATKTCLSTSLGSCRIPKIENGKFLYLDKNFLAGYSIPSYSYIQIYCNKGYALYPKNRYINCVNSTWHIPIPQCKQTCPPLISSLTRNIICTVDDKLVQCSRPVIDGAIAQIVCNDGSELITKCTTGSWDKRNPFNRCKSGPVECNNEHLNNCTIHSTTSKPDTFNNSCLVPKIENGKYFVYGRQYKQGDYIPNYAIVHISCNQNYALYPENSGITFCNNGIWITKIPECKRTCSPLLSTSVDIVCSVDGVTVDCAKALVDGTIAKSKCKMYYTMAYPSFFSTTRCIEGTWDSPLMRCIPECGNSISAADKELVINNKTVKSTIFPWHVAVYRLENDKHQYICGGSIITPSVVISAAICFTTDNGNALPFNEFYLGAGKYYSAFNASGDKFAQIRQVQKIYIPPIYKGYETSYAGDIAVVVVENPFTLSNVVFPVCVDWDRNFERQQLTPNSVGTVVGWGLADPKDFKPSEVLKQIPAPFVNLEKCLTAITNAFFRFITPDKFCAGFANGTSVCKGDSGGGLVFPWTVNNKIKYYLRGITSVGPVTENTCDLHQYSVFTQLSYYIDFIQDIIVYI